jgi:hypothetical protein
VTTCCPHCQVHKCPAPTPLHAQLTEKTQGSSLIGCCAAHNSQWQTGTSHSAALRVEALAASSTAVRTGWWHHRQRIANQPESSAVCDAIGCTRERRTRCTRDVWQTAGPTTAVLVLVVPTPRQPEAVGLRVTAGPCRCCHRCRCSCTWP